MINMKIKSPCSLICEHPACTKNANLLTLILLISLFVISTNINAATYYLDADNGDDDANGLSVETAWETITKARTTVTGGDTIVMAEGDYGGFLQVGGGEMYSDWVTFQAADGATPNLDLISITGSAVAANIIFDGLTITQIEGVEYCIKVANFSNLKFRNLTLIGLGYTLATTTTSKAIQIYTAASAIDITNCTIRGAAEGRLGGFAYGAHIKGIDVTISDCDISGCYTGIYIDQSEDISILDSNIHNIASDNIVFLGVDTLLIQGNEIHDLDIYKPTLDETPTATTFSEDGLTMTNANAHWNTAGATLASNTELWVTAGTNVKIGTDNIYVTVVSDTEITLSATVASGGTPSNVTYYFRALAHTDLLQANVPNYDIPLARSDNVTIKGNKFYDSDEQIMWLNPAHSYPLNYWVTNGGHDYQETGIYGNLANRDNEPGVGANWETYWTLGDNPGEDPAWYQNAASTYVIENNIFYNTYTSSVLEAKGVVLVGSISNAVFRNNIVIGSLKCTSPSNTNITMKNNIISLANWGTSYEHFIDESYNIINNDVWDVTIVYDETTDFMGGDWDNTTFRALFTDFDTNDFTHTSAEALGVGHSDPENSPISDILGNSRDASPDAGCYEYISGQTYTLNTTADHGTVAKSPDKASYNSGETVTLTATPNTGYDFANWSGDASGTNNPVTITMNSNKSVIANFAAVQPTTYTLSITATNGLVTKTPDNDSYNYGDTVTIQAVPNTGYAFTNWSGNASGSSNPVTITMNTNKSVTANFNAIVDNTAPSVTGMSPTTNAIQVPLNSLIILHITDAGEGVDSDTVVITLDDSVIYSGDTTNYLSDSGYCRRLGTSADYTYIYLPGSDFDFDQAVAVKVSAADLAGNALTEYSYSFATEMQAFSENKKVSTSSDDDASASTIIGADGNIWVAWNSGKSNAANIYIASYTPDADNFSSPIQVTSESSDQINPKIAIDSNGKFYMVWQDNREGNWDVYYSTSTNGINWSTSVKVTDSQANQTNPVIAVVNATTPQIYVFWEDDRNTNSNIYAAFTINDFQTQTLYQVTTDTAEQTRPVAVTSATTVVYVLWTDYRNGNADIYGGASNTGPWTNIAVVTGSSNQSSPAVAAEADENILHLVWVDDSTGNGDIFYASTDGLPSGPLTGSSVIDDTTSTEQSQPVITVSGSTGQNLKVFACWKDARNISSSSDYDLYLVELSQKIGTNILINDDYTNSNQDAPAIGMNSENHPYIVWADTRNVNSDIYYAAGTFAESTPIASVDVLASEGATVGVDPDEIDSADDVSVIIPAGACICDVTITITRVNNPQKLSLQRFSTPYEFGPSGMQFSQPVTITIPYAVSDESDAYWYNSLTGLQSRDGISNVETIVISDTLHALRFKTTHFTEFFVGAAIAAAGGGGGGGGGCSMSHSADTSIVEFAVPYIFLAIVIAVIKSKDKKTRCANNQTKE